MDAPPVTPAQQLLAEAIGTFALVALGCGAIAVDAATGALGHLGVSLAFGLVVGAMVFATGHLSGAHLNPAVTVAFAALGRFPWRRVPGYVAAQCAAGLAGAGLVRAVMGEAGQVGATTPALALGPAAAVEAGLTATLMFVIAAVATDSRAQGQLAALAIGGTVALGALVGGPLTGASMNPARSLGPAVVGGALADLPLYLVAPVAGATLGALAYRAASRGIPASAAAGTSSGR